MDRRLGGPLPHQLPNPTRAHRMPSRLFTPYHAVLCAYAVLAAVSSCYPPAYGRLPTRYSPVRHSVIPVSIRKLQQVCFVRLACVKHAASVHPEPGSNSLIKFDLGQDPIAGLFTLVLLFYKVSSLNDSSRTFKVVSLFSYQCARCFENCFFRSEL